MPSLETSFFDRLTPLIIWIRGFLFSSFGKNCIIAGLLDKLSIG